MVAGMPKVNYPDPHPFKVMGLPKATAWNYRGNPTPSAEDVIAYMASPGTTWTAERAEEWRASVDSAKAINNAGKPVSTEPAKVPARASAPVAVPEAAPVVASMRHLAPRPEREPMEPVTVRLPSSLNARLDRYRIHHRVSKQDVVSDVLEAFLTAQGF